MWLEEAQNMDLKLVQCAATILADARRHSRQIDHLPEECRPRSLEEARAIHEAVIAQLGDRIVGWKVGAKSPKHPASVAPLMHSLVLQSPATISSKALSLFGIEAEVAFRFSKDMPKRVDPYGQDEVIDAIASVHPVIEVMESRYSDFLKVDWLSIVADNITNGYLIVGPAIADWQKLDLMQPQITVRENGRLLALGIGNNGGDPYRLLTDLANYAAAREAGLKKGMIVTTGTCTGITFSQRGRTVDAAFKRMGNVQVSL